jgi:hypothetical protein
VPGGERTLVVACAALTKEIRLVLGQLGNPPVDVVYLPAPLHNRPERIPGEVEAAIETHRQGHDRVVIGYADCGTGGLLDGVIERHGAERLPGAHCYAFFAGIERFDALQDAEPGTFYLTDYLARHFDALVMGSLGLDRHPELRDLYSRVVLLSQTDDAEVIAAGERAAALLGLSFEHHHVGMEPFRRSLGDLLAAVAP